MFHELHFLRYVGCPIHPVLLLQAVPVKTCSNAIFFSPCEHRLFQAFVSGNHSYAATGFGVLPDVPPGCGPLLLVIIPVASFAVSLQFGFLC